MVTFKNQTNEKQDEKGRAGCVEIGTLVPLWRGCTMVSPLCGVVRRFLRKLGRITTRSSVTQKQRKQRHLEVQVYSYSQERKGSSDPGTRRRTMVDTMSIQAVGCGPAWHARQRGWTWSPHLSGICRPHNVKRRAAAPAMRCLKAIKTVGTESEWWSPGAGGRESGELSFNM